MSSEVFGLGLILLFSFMLSKGEFLFIWMFLLTCWKSKLLSKKQHSSFTKFPQRSNKKQTGIIEETTSVWCGWILTWLCVTRWWETASFLDQPRKSITGFSIIITSTIIFLTLCACMLSLPSTTLLYVYFLFYCILSLSPCKLPFDWISIFSLSAANYGSALEQKSSFSFKDCNHCGIELVFTTLHAVRVNNWANIQQTVWRCCLLPVWSSLSLFLPLTCSCCCWLVSECFLWFLVFFTCHFCSLCG